eukprot:TRINITY_DN1174_c0_g1_i2.p1 TRINITY_DN1174_c0_g1~~TRINITY_DN1174_c0_g1_i2.p1  ORF type:complete len:600 (+),score=197.22 TRINITY_DN1174_c0_g1_i2:69-1868(+)
MSTGKGSHSSSSSDEKPADRQTGPRGDYSDDDQAPSSGSSSSPVRRRRRGSPDPSGRSFPRRKMRDARPARQPSPVSPTSPGSSPRAPPAGFRPEAAPAAAAESPDGDALDRPAARTTRSGLPPPIALGTGVATELARGEASQPEPRRVTIGGSTVHEMSPGAVAADLQHREVIAAQSQPVDHSQALRTRLTGKGARKATAPLSIAKSIQSPKLAAEGKPAVEIDLSAHPAPKRTKSIRLEGQARRVPAVDSVDQAPLLAKPDVDRVVAVACTARQYSLQALEYRFRSRRGAVVEQCVEGSTDEQVLLCTVPAAALCRGVENTQCEVFFFHYGVVAFWGPNDSRLWDAVLSDVEEAGGFDKRVGRKDELDVERCAWSYERETARKYALTSASDTGYDAPATPRKVRESTLDNDHFQLATQDSDVKLAYSFAMAQSQKLTSYEDKIDDLISRTRQFPEELQRDGEVNLSSREIARRKGELFTQRMEVSLYTDLLDTPDYFWDRTDLEPLYKNGRSYFEISRRVRVLNERLNVVAELFDMLHEQQKQKHSDRLEWIVIWLIAVEILVAGVDILLKVYPIEGCPKVPTVSAAAIPGVLTLAT